MSGKHLIYQKYSHRSEMWTFVSGEGIFILNGVIKKIGREDTASIYPEMLHGLKAITELQIIEVQIGDALIEEDVDQVDYDWNKI